MEDARAVTLINTSYPSYTHTNLITSRHKDKHYPVQRPAMPKGNEHGLIGAHATRDALQMLYFITALGFSIHLLSIANLIDSSYTINTSEI